MKNLSAALTTEITLEAKEDDQIILEKVQVNSGRNDALVDISYVEKKYNASWVGQFPLKTRDGNWAESPADVFYQVTPPVSGYSNYFGLIIQQGSLYITDASIVPKQKIVGVIANDGEIIYSRYRHDYRQSKDGSVFIDGGFDYVRSNIIDTILLKVIDGEFYQIRNKE